MNIIELGISMLAPHTCLVCKKEGAPVCPACANRHYAAPAPICFRCGRKNKDALTCEPCFEYTALEHVWIATEYKGLAKQTVGMLKFQRAKAAAGVIARQLHLQLPKLPPDIVISPVPTAYPRVRMRGYDQAQLIARQFAQKRGLTCSSVLRRITNTRQVGANRHDRFLQLQDAFTVNSKRIQGKHILLIDDVMTTGATLESAAHVLMQNGAGLVDAAVFAHKV